MGDHCLRKLMCTAAFMVWASASSYAAAESAPVSLDQPGQILSMEFNLSKCEVIFIGLRFSTKGLSRAEELRLIGNGTYRTVTKEFINPGITVPLRIRIVKIEKNLFGPIKETEIDSWEYSTRGISSFSPVTERTVSRNAGSITLPRGKYRVEVSLLEGIPALSGIPVSFWLGSTFKVSPNRDRCFYRSGSGRTVCNAGRKAMQGNEA